MRIDRRLGDVHQDLTTLAKQGNIVEFLASAENVQRINGLVEDIREVMMDYQVCVKQFISTMSNFCVGFIATRYL